MTSSVRRAAVFALVGTLALAVPVVAGAGAPLVGALAGATGIAPVALATTVGAGPFLLVAGFALRVDADRPVFDLFARPGDRQDRTLYGLAGFSLAAAGLALLVGLFGLPVYVYVGSVFVLAFGNVAGNLTDRVTHNRVLSTGGFVLGGFAAAVVGQVVAARLVGLPVTTSFLAELAFLAASGALLGALLRSVLFERDDPLVMISIGFLLWLLADLPMHAVSTSRILVALGVTVAFGYAAYALDTASLPGMLTGVFLGLLTIVLGGYEWFALLITFFGVGGLSAKFRYEEKRRRGIAEANDGARGSGNVLANSLVAVIALLGAAASPSHTGVPATPFLYAFTGSLAAALSDTLSSEVGGLFDGPRLVTSFERVDPGTDGAVTWQGEVAGVAGAAVLAAIATPLFDSVGVRGGAVVLVAGIVGMTVDSLLGATLEGTYLGNQGVNLLSTLSAAVTAGGLAVGLGLALP